MQISPTENIPELDKRTRIPFVLTDDCPECGETATRDLSEGDYLAFPVPNTPFEFTFGCIECDHNWGHKVILKVTLEKV